MNENIKKTYNLKDNLELPCGVILKNRLAKSPMSDSLGDGEGNPTEAQISLYERWSNGGVALSFVGEVQVDYLYPEKPGNLVLGPKSNHEMLTLFTKRTIINDSQLWAQLGCAGALAYAPISKPKGPSTINIEGLQCEGMNNSEIQSLPNLYARAANIAKRTGFSGVLIHAGHGFLLSQFLSPLFNRRKDNYGGAIENRSRIIIDIIKEVREAVGPLFPIGIRINSSDNLEGGLTQDDALELVKIIDKTTIDIIDISGGTYFPGAVASPKSSSQGPYYIDFAKQARSLTNIPLMLTGGFKTRAQAVDAIESGIIDMVGVGRAMILEPNLANFWLNDQDNNPNFPKFNHKVPGGLTAWYSMKQVFIGEKNEQNFDMDLKSSIEAYEERDRERCNKWTKMFY